MTAKERVKRYVSSEPNSEGKTVSAKERVKQKIKEINSPQNSEDYMLGKSMLDRLSMGEATPELTKQIGETVIRRDTAIEKGEQKEKPNFLGFLTEKAASGAAESTEGTLNAWSRIGQMLESQRLQQSLESQMAAARLFGDKELADALMQQTVEQAKINTGRDKGLIDPFDFGDRYAEKTEKKYADADFGTAGRLAGDVAQGVGGLLPSIASNIVAPGSGMVVMTSGAFGNATQEAKKNGADDATAMAYGLAVGAVEALTEKMYGGMGGIFGKGPVDDLVKDAINSHIKNGAARAGLNTLVSMFGEGLEEFVAEYGQLLADKLTIKKDERGFFSGETLSDAGRSALIGGIIGGLLNISDSIQAGKTPKEATQEAVEKVAESISEEESTAEPQTPAKTAKERVRKKAEAAKAKETEDKIPRMELKGIEEETTTAAEPAPAEEEIPRMELKGIEDETEPDTQPDVQSAPAAKPAPTGTATERQRMQARAIGDMVEAGAAAKTSPAALGIENGGDIESITVLEEPLTKMFDFSEASEIAERAGYEPVYFSGMLQNANGGTSRWGIAGNKLYIQADSANYTAADIAKEAVERSKTNETISDRGQDERYAGLSAGGQTERISQQGGSQARRAAARENKAASYAAERASDYISDGSTEQTLKIIPAADYDGELKAIDKTLRKMGAKKVYFTIGSIGIVNPTTGESASVSGVYDSDSGVMMVRADSDIYTAQQLAMHEAFHYIADADPTIREDAYNRLFAEMSEGEMDELTARYQVAYGNIYGDNVDAYVDEILADAYAGINRENLGADRYRSAVNSAVMAAARPETEQRQTNGPNERYTYGGEGAKTANYDNLRSALDMEAGGIDKDAIRRETGWFKGADGKWRFEINDSSIKLAAPEQIINYMRLGELIDAPELFAAYPDMADIEIVFQGLDKGVYGQYNRQFDSIDLAYNLKNDPKALLNSLVHEMQHAIQSREHFAHGATVAYWERQLQNGFNGKTQMQRRELQRLWQIYNNIRDNEPEFFEAMVELESITPDVPRGAINWDTLEKIEEDPIEWQRYDAAREALEEQYGDLKVWDFTDLRYKLIQMEKNTGRSATDLYYDTAGEIEARDAARRRTMTAEQRRATMPNIGNEDTVFAESGWVNSSQYDAETASIKEQIQNSAEKLNNMNVVGNASVPQNLKNKDSASAWATDILKSTGYQVDRQGYGIIYFSKKDIDKGLRYADTAAEKAAIVMLPQVLKKGIEIGSHEQHKNRSKQTITFAAPVELNGIRGNMAVVVNKNGNHYYAHRIVLPDGTEFRFSEEKNNAAQELSRGVTVSGSLADTTSAASAMNVAESRQDVKQRFSINDDNEQKEINDTLEKLSDEARQRAREAVLAEREAARQQAALKPAATADEVVERKVAEAKAEAAEENAPELLAAKLSNSRGDFTGSAALEKLGIKVVNSIGKYTNVKQLLGNARAGRSIARERKKAEIRLKVTAKEKNFARGIANGIYTESDIPEGWDKRTVMEMSEWYMAERNFGESYIDLLKQAITVDVDAATAQMFEGADESKVPAAIVLNHRTAQRNMLNIFGDKGKEINKWLFDPVNQNEAERLRFINRQFDQVRTFEDQTGKQRALNKAEREMVQRVIEGRVVEDALAKLENRKDIETAADSLRKGEDIGDIGLEFGLTLEEQEIVESLVKWQDVQDQLEAMDKVIIYNAVDKYSALFDSYYEAINDFLAAHGYQPIGFIKGYVPHLQPEENQTALQNVFQKLGLNTDVSSLPTSIAGLTGDYKPNKKWNPYFLHRNSTVTQFDIVEAFESYVSKMADVLYHADDIMRIRSAVKYFRRTYSPEEIRNSIEWAENLRTMPKDEKIAFLYDEGIITSGAGLSHADAKDMLNKYIEEQYGKIENTSKFNNLVTYLENYANILAGKQSIADRGSENSLGRMILNVGNRMTRIFSTANVAGNISSALNQSAQLPTILAENGLRNTTAAFKDIITGNLRKAGWAEDSDFLTGKRGVKFIVSTKYEMFLDKAFKPLEIVDSLMSTLAVRGAYLNGIKQGMSHEAAMQYADKKAASIMGDRTKGAKPIQFEAKNPINSMVHLFQIEVLNSWDHIASDLPQDFRTIAAVQGKRKAAQAVAGVLSKMLVYSFVLNRLAEKLYGGTPAPFDIFGLTANFIASGQELSTNAYLEALIDKVMLELFGMELFGSDEDERMQLSDGEFEWEAAAEDLGYNISNELPFLNNLSALLGLGDKTLPVPDIITPFEGTYRGIKNKSAAEALDAALHIIEDIVPTGRQIIKTYTGAKMIAQGGKMKGFGEKARLQYPVRRTAGNITQALLFGASGLQENQDFYASGRTALTTKETALWKTLVANGADEEDAYDAIYSTKGEDVKTYEKLLMMAAPLEWSNGLKYDAMAGVTSDSFGYKLNVLESNDIDASEYAEVTAEMYDISAARIADLPEEDRPETVTISQEDAEKALKASNLSKQEKAIIWQMTNAGWSEKSNPFSNSIGKRVKAEYKEIKEQAEEEKRKEEEEDEIPRMQLRGLD